MHVLMSVVLFFAALSGALLYNHAEAPAKVSELPGSDQGETAVSAATATATKPVEPPEEATTTAPTEEPSSPEDTQEVPNTEETEVVAPKAPAAVPPSTSESPPAPRPIAEADLPVVEELPRVSKPLVVTQPAPAQVAPLPDLHAQGVLGYTNAARFKNGLDLYTADNTLTRIAARKMQDMFDRQYFAHEAPDGRDVANLAQEEGYAYLLVGENLAVGGFRDNEHLVDEWLNSPGHRANILSDEFSEIGIAVGRGIYEGREAWMAVQAFGLPRDACPAPDEALLGSIEQAEVYLSGLNDRISALGAELQDTTQTSPLFRERYDAYIAVVESYNKSIEEQRDMVSDYNRQVNTYNSCLEELR